MPLIENKKIFRCLFGGALLFLLLLVCTPSARCSQFEWKGVEKIVAVGDLHGDYENFVSILKGMKLVDDRLRWTGGGTHLVQLGDVMDRGSDSRKILDLMMRLEEEARNAGGYFHFLIGNHEELNITGLAFDYSGYITLDQFFDYLPDAERQKLEKTFRDGDDKNDNGTSGPFLPLSSEVKRFWRKQMADERVQNQYYRNFNRIHGKWIIDHHLIVKINDIIFTHAGINERYSRWNLKKMNDLYREELARVRAAQVYGQPLHGRIEFVYREDGPHWYRELASGSEESLRPVVDRILKNLKAQSMVVGHSSLRKDVSSLKEISRFDGRIWTIDTGIAAYYGSHICALIIDKGNFYLYRGHDDQ